MYRRLVIAKEHVGVLEVLFTFVCICTVPLQGSNFPLGRHGAVLCSSSGLERRIGGGLPRMPVLLQVQHRTGVRLYYPRHVFQGDLQL
jgi:hypothetical protein